MMTTNIRKPSIALNYIFHTLQQLLAMLLPLITTPYVSRILEADGVGINSYVTANVTYFTIFSWLGIAGYGRREIAAQQNNKQEASKIFWELEIVHLILCLLTTTAYVVLIMFAGKYRIYYIINFIAIISSIIDINWVFEAYEKFKFIAIRNCLIKIVTVFLVFTLIKDKEDLILYIVLNLMAVFVGNLSVWPAMYKMIQRVPLKSLNCKRHMKDILVYFIPTIAASVYSLLDKSVINWVTRSEAENGYYEQATKVLSMVHVVVQSLSTVSAARMTMLLTSNHNDEAKHRLNHSLCFMLMIAMPCTWGVMGIANRFVPLFFGAGYDTVIVLLYIMMPLVVVLGFSVYVDGMYLVPSGQRGRSAKAVCVGASVNFFTNLVLVYFWGAVGAAVATLITEIIVSTIMVIMAKNMLDGKYLIFNMLKYGCFGFVLFVVAKLIDRIVYYDSWCVIIQIVVCVMLYGVLLLVTKDIMFFELWSNMKAKLKEGLKGIHS